VYLVSILRQTNKLTITVAYCMISTLISSKLLNNFSFKLQFNPTIFYLSKQLNACLCDRKMLGVILKTGKSELLLTTVCTRELSFCLLVNEFLKLVHFWRSYRQNGLIACPVCQAGQCMVNRACEAIKPFCL